MSHGRCTVEAPHICGEVITVEIDWWASGYSYWNPPDYDEQWQHDPCCPKCKVDLDYDTIFQATVEALKKDAPCDEDPEEPDYEPDDEHGQEAYYDWRDDR